MELHEAEDAIDKLLTEMEHLDRIAGGDDLSPASIELALSVTKKVRRASTIAVQALARARDQLHAKEATSNDGT